jgi:hypothetical protein
MRRVKFVGLDVHAETIAPAVAEQDGEVRSLGVIPNRAESIRKLVKKLGPVEELQTRRGFSETIACGVDQIALYHL